eukprot:UN23014
MNYLDGVSGTTGGLQSSAGYQQNNNNIITKNQNQSGGTTGYLHENEKTKTLSEIPANSNRINNRNYLPTSITSTTNNSNSGNNHSTARAPPGFANKTKPDTLYNNQSNIGSRPTNTNSANSANKNKRSGFGPGDVVSVFHHESRRHYPAKIINVSRDRYLIEWQHNKRKAQVGFGDVREFKQQRKKASTGMPPVQTAYGAVRHLEDCNKWQTRTPDGDVLKQLFDTREEATEFLRIRKRDSEKNSQQY